MPSSVTSKKIQSGNISYKICKQNISPADKTKSNTNKSPNSSTKVQEVVLKGILKNKDNVNGTHVTHKLIQGTNANCNRVSENIKKPGILQKKDEHKSSPRSIFKKQGCKNGTIISPSIVKEEECKDDKQKPPSIGKQEQCKDVKPSTPKKEEWKGDKVSPPSDNVEQLESAEATVESVNQEPNLIKKEANLPLIYLNDIKLNKPMVDLTKVKENVVAAEYLIKNKMDNIKKIMNVIPSTQNRHNVNKENKKKMQKNEKAKHPVVKREKIGAEIVQELTLLANFAIKHQRTFTIHGNFYAMRKALEARGWVEKINIQFMDHKTTWARIAKLPQHELLKHVKSENCPAGYRKMFKSKLLGESHQVDLLWSYRDDPALNDCVMKTTVNRYPRKATNYFTTKAGLCDTLRSINSTCYCKRELKVLFPRTYNLGRGNEVEAFVYDFRHTAAISLLQYVVELYNKPGRIVCVNDKVLASAYCFAAEQCKQFIRNIESALIKPEAAPKEEDWDKFLENYYTVVSHQNGLKENDKATLQVMVNTAEQVLSKLSDVWPYLNTDGIMNLWLLKPKFGSQGRGINVCRTWSTIFKILHSQNRSNYIAQKYIERPLLIYDTKFDIRQWLLVTTLPTLKVWMYRKCYLRFSSQLYTLKRSDEAIHLTNNSVQCKYKNCQRSYLLPEQNMWDSDQFRRYLIQQDFKCTWKDIYQNMKNAIKEVLQLHAEELYTRSNRYELLGADFMLDENCRPYLLEINCRPALNPSTPVTNRMVPILLTDIVKVVVDNTRNPKASTGDFELICTLNNNEKQ